MTYSASNALLARLVYDKARVNQQAVDNATYTLADGTQWSLKYFGSDPNGYQGGSAIGVQCHWGQSHLTF